ncbi:MAG: PfkB family carbohydrate kinase [Puniceicoccales bacterium]|jgi:sugar/nucleoside kinase (ribokinase family)|nr:PfkB family carbohydrate kinase [Puniceicoccales bacterium]
MQRIQISNATPAPLLITGSIAYDDIITPRGNGEKLIGGSASYASLAASYFTDVRLVGVVGNDFLNKDRERFRIHEIDTKGLHTDESGPTLFWKGKYHENYNRRDTMTIELGVFANFRPELPAGYEQTPFVLLANIAPGLHLHVLGQMQSPRFVVADSMDLWIEIARPELEQVIKRVNLFVVNDSEAEHLTGESNVIVAGQKLREIGAKIVLIKKGEHGALLFHEDGLFALPAYPVTQLHDPTGAGDSFAGALIGTLAALQRTDFEAIKLGMLYATAAASLTVEAFSCDRLESAGITEIEARVKTLRTITALPQLD